MPPYNEVLGGKPVAMFMVGPEVVAEYRRRYGGPGLSHFGPFFAAPSRRRPGTTFRAADP